MLDESKTPCFPVALARPTHLSAKRAVTQGSIKAILANNGPRSGMSFTRNAFRNNKRNRQNSVDLLLHKS